MERGRPAGLDELTPQYGPRLAFTRSLVKPAPPAAAAPPPQVVRACAVPVIL